MKRGTFKVLAMVNTTEPLLTITERSLLLFLESRSVDNAGRVQTVHMNYDDMEIAERWNLEGFVKFGRIRSADLSKYGNHWCFLSDEAWKLAHAERKARAARMWKNRTWKTTDENQTT